MHLLSLVTCRSSDKYMMFNSCVLNCFMIVYCLCFFHCVFQLTFPPFFFLFSRFQIIFFYPPSTAQPLCATLFSFAPSHPPNLPHPCLSNSFQANIQTFVDSHLETAFSSGWVSGSFHTSRLINLQTCRPPKQERGQWRGRRRRMDRKGDDGLGTGSEGRWWRRAETKENWALRLT